MAKKWYEITLKPLQPLHIGSGNYGVVNPTWIYIPGWTIWGALTAAYGIKNGWNKNTLSDQQKELFEQVSNFYPVIDGKTLFPNYKKGVFCLGNYTEKEFRYYATDTFISTGINPSTQTAQDKMLHEIEYILTTLKEKKSKIFWRGILFIDLNQHFSDFLKRGQIIAVGGEKNKGFGMMRIDMINECSKLEEWNSDKDKTAHFVGKAQLIESGKSQFIAEIEDSNKYNLKLKSLKNLYLPGSIKKKKDMSNGKLVKGVWQINKNNV